MVREVRWIKNDKFISNQTSPEHLFLWRLGALFDLYIKSKDIFHDVFVQIQKHLPRYLPSYLPKYLGRFPRECGCTSLELADRRMLPGQGCRAGPADGFDLILVEISGEYPPLFFLAVKPSPWQLM